MPRSLWEHRTVTSWLCPRWENCRWPVLAGQIPLLAEKRRNILKLHVLCGPGNVDSIATGYGLDSPWIESRWGWRFSAPVQTGPGAHTASFKMGAGSFPGLKSGQGVKLTPHPLLVPWSWKGRAIPLLPLRAVGSVQSLSACTRVHVTFSTLLTRINP